MTLPCAHALLVLHGDRSRRFAHSVSWQLILLLALAVGAALMTFTPASIGGGITLRPNAEVLRLWRSPASHRTWLRRDIYGKYQVNTYVGCRRMIEGPETAVICLQVTVAFGLAIINTLPFQSGGGSSGGAKERKVLRWVWEPMERWSCSATSGADYSSRSCGNHHAFYVMTIIEKIPDDEEAHIIWQQDGNASTVEDKFLWKIYIEK